MADQLVHEEAPEWYVAGSNKVITVQTVALLLLSPAEESGLIGPAPEAQTWRRLDGQPVSFIRLNGEHNGDVIVGFIHLIHGLW